jgi:hypothetical protein
LKVGAVAMVSDLQLLVINGLPSLAFALRVSENHGINPHWPISTRPCRRIGPDCQGPMIGKYVSTGAGTLKDSAIRCGDVVW